MRYYRTTTARQTGFKVTTGHADDLGLDDGDGATRWYNVCEQHDHIIGHETLELARAHSSDPLGWCESCMDLAAKERAKAQALADVLDRW